MQYKYQKMLKLDDAFLRAWLKVCDFKDGNHPYTFFQELKGLKKSIRATRLHLSPCYHDTEIRDQIGFQC